MGKSNFRVKNVTVIYSGIREKGKNAGKAYAVCHCLYEGKHNINFSVFDSEDKTFAEKILNLVEGGTTEMYIKLDNKKNHVQFVETETLEERAAFIEQKTKKNARAEVTVHAKTFPSFLKKTLNKLKFI